MGYPEVSAGWDSASACSRRGQGGGPVDGRPSGWRCGGAAEKLVDAGEVDEELGELMRALGGEG